MKTQRNICYGKDARSQVLDLYLPDESCAALFVYFHGGGLENGDKSAADGLASYLTRRGIAVVSANYRMYPSASYPDFIYDAAEAVAWASRYMRSECAGIRRLFVGGSSAGGYLSMMLCFDPKYLTSVGLDNSCIAGYFHDAGQPTAHFSVLKHRGIDPRRVIVDDTSALYYVGCEPSYPPMRFIVSDDDMKGRYEQTMLMLSTLSHFGYQRFDHVVMHGQHCAYCEAFDEKGESVLGRMIYSFIQGTED